MPTTTHPNEHAAKVAAKWWLQARNRLNIAGEAIAIHIGHELDPGAFIAGVNDPELQKHVTQTMRKLDSSLIVAALQGKPILDENALRARFEKLASDPSHKFQRSPRGTYRNPAVARDWKWFRAGAAAASQKGSS